MKSKIVRVAKKAQCVIALSDKAWWLIIVALGVWILMAGAPASLWVKTSRVIIPDGETADEIVLEVHQEIRRPFVGRYLVEVRHFPTGLRICGGTNPRPIDYRPDQSGVVYRPLWWWLGSYDDLERCKRNGMNHGYFVLWTRRYVTEPFGGLVPEKSADPIASNVFRIGTYQ